MTADEVLLIADKIVAAEKVIVNTYRGLEDVIKQGVSMANVTADLEADISLLSGQIAFNEANATQTQGKIELLIKFNFEIVKEKQLLNLASDYKSSLKRLEYSLLK